MVMHGSTTRNLVGWYTCFQSDLSHIPCVDLVLLLAEEGVAAADDDDDDNRADERNVPMRKVNAYTVIINIVYHTCSAVLGIATMLVRVCKENGFCRKVSILTSGNTSKRLLSSISKELISIIFTCGLIFFTRFTNS